MIASLLKQKPFQSTTVAPNGVRQREMNMDIIAAIAAILIFPKDYFISVFGIHTEILGIALLTAAALLVLIAKGIPKINFTGHLLIAVVLLIAWIVSMIWNGSPNNSSYYASFFAASLLTIMRPKRFLLVMAVLMTINTLLQVNEAITGTFFFSYVDDEYEYDEKMLSVGEGGLRVKGLFASPLNAISVLISLALLTPRSYYIWILLCVSSALGQGRLGLGVGILGLFILAFSGGKSSLKRRAANIVLTTIGMGIVPSVIVLFGTDDSIQRLLEAGSADNSQNVSRLLYWGQSIAELMDYDLMSHLFGRFGYIKALQGGTESDWLRLWLDNGIFCMLTYFIPLSMGFFYAMRDRHSPEIYRYIGTIFVMAVYPHAQSLPNGILVWLLVLGTLKTKPRDNPGPHSPQRLDLAFK